MSILLLASQSEDRIHYPNSPKVTQEGGPFLYISRFLSKKDVSFTAPDQDKAIVDLYVDNEGERGNIIQNEKIFFPENIESFSDIIISTVSPNSMDLTYFSSIKNNIYLDLQGFTRANPTELERTIRNIFLNISPKIIKGTKYEFELISNCVPTNKNTIFIQTNGVKGIDIIKNRRRRHVEIPRIVPSKDTIGAGDTFFASLVFHLIKNDSVYQSVKLAAIDVCDFLETK